MKIAVFGSNGRVGKKVCEIAKKRNHIVFEIDKNGPTKIIPNEEKIDCAIDFSVAEATSQVCDFCKLHRCPLVTGVTGRTDEQQRQIDELGKLVRVEEKANFSKGIEILTELCRQISATGWDCEIVETHRKGKADRPSGTAKQLALAVTKNGNNRQVTVHSVRVGCNFGKHEVIFATDGESLTLTHQAESIDIFALGAVECAEKITKPDNCDS